MLQYVLAGIALGSIYAIASAGIVITYVSAGVLNFAFASMAYFVARFYYWLNSQHGWPTNAAGAVSILVLAPVMGILLYLVLFRFIRGKPTLVKLVATIGLSVALPVVADLLFGTQTITSAPGLASLSDQPFRFLGAPVTTDQVITYGFLIAIVLVGVAVLRFTDVGLKVRAVVDSDAMASLSGVNPSRVALGVWAASATLAGIAGILVAPSNGLTTVGMTTLMAAAFAAVVVARLRSLPIAVLASLAMGVLTDVLQKYLPQNNAFTSDLITSIPFVFILIALFAQLMRSGPVLDDSGTAGPLDDAIQPAHESIGFTESDGRSFGRMKGALGAAPWILIAALPIIFRGSQYWLGLVALGFCYAITFLTYTIVTGEGGMLWLSQIIFAGAGAIAAAQFVSVWHIPVLLAIIMAGMLVAGVGAIIGLLTIRLGDLYVALVTLSFGLLVETLVFTQGRFLQGGLGVAISPPAFASSVFALSYLALAVFAVFAILTVNLRRSTSGIALRAVRDSEEASRTIGLSVLQVKVIVAAIAAFVAAIGGAFLSIDAAVAQPQSYETFVGLVWLAVVATMGVRSITGAALAGLAFALLPGVFSVYIPSQWAEVPALLFGLGAIGFVRHPEGIVVHTGRQLRRFLTRMSAPGSWSQPGGEGNTEVRVPVLTAATSDSASPDSAISL
jgi:branched-chain amino acid transport system permease protein